MKKTISQICFTPYFLTFLQEFKHAQNTKNFSWCKTTFGGQKELFQLAILFSHITQDTGLHQQFLYQDQTSN